MIVRQVTLLCLASSFHLDSKPQKVTYLNESKNSRKKTPVDVVNIIAIETKFVFLSLDLACFIFVLYFFNRI